MRVSLKLHYFSHNVHIKQGFAFYLCWNSLDVVKNTSNKRNTVMSFLFNSKNYNFMYFLKSNLIHQVRSFDSVDQYMKISFRMTEMWKSFQTTKKQFSLFVFMGIFLLSLWNPKKKIIFSHIVKAFYKKPGKTLWHGFN